jgi:hypothetical protein
MHSATRLTIGTFGVIAGLAAIEHGVGEIAQGNRAPGGIMFLSWPDSPAFRIVNGEPAMTIVPNLLLTGILAIVVALIFMVWATVFVQRAHGGLILIALALLLLLAGGGFGPPLLGIILGLAATRINPRPARLGAAHTRGPRHALSQVWPWALGAGVVAWLLVIPGSMLIDYGLGLTIPDLAMYTLIISAFGLLLLAIVTAFARDGDSRAVPRGIEAIRT